MSYVLALSPSQELLIAHKRYLVHNADSVNNQEIIPGYLYDLNVSCIDDIDPSRTSIMIILTCKI